MKNGFYQLQTRKLMKYLPRAVDEEEGVDGSILKRVICIDHIDHKDSCANPKKCCC
jgi:hypothetical protein